MNKLYPITTLKRFDKKKWGHESVLLDHDSIITNGDFIDRKFSDIINIYKKELLGNIPLLNNKFPIILKYINAEGNLSIQNHPGGCDEQWIVTSVQNENCCLYHNFKDGVDIKVIQNRPYNDILSSMNNIKAKIEDNIFIHGGDIHCIGSGIGLFEVSFNNTKTLRLSDQYNRPLDKNECLNVYKNSIRNKKQTWNMNVTYNCVIKSSAILIPIDRTMEIRYNDYYYHIPKLSIVFIPPHGNFKIMNKIIKMIQIEWIGD